MTWQFDGIERNALITDLQIAGGHYLAADTCLPGDSVEEAARQTNNLGRRNQINQIVNRLQAGKGYVDRNDGRWVAFRQASANLTNGTKPCRHALAVIQLCQVLDGRLDVVDTVLVQP